MATFSGLAAARHAMLERAGWDVVDGALGLWAAATPRLRHLTGGMQRRLDGGVTWMSGSRCGAVARCCG